MMAAEMAVIRLTHVADLPSPEELVRKLQDTPPPPMPQGGGSPGNGGGRSANGGGGTVSSQAQPGYSAAPSGGGSAPTAALAQSVDSALARFPTFDHVIELIRANRDVKLLVEVEGSLRLAAYQPGRIEFQPTDSAPADLAQRLGSRLQSWTGNRWAVIVVNEGGRDTIVEQRDAAENAIKSEASEHPMVQAVLTRFPKARITQVRTPDQMAATALSEALPEVEDEWDPFEDD